MSVENDTLSDAVGGPAPIVFGAPERRHRLSRRRRRPPRPRVKKLRLLFVGTAFLGLAIISVLFGVLTSIASDLPQLKNTVQFRGNVDSYLYDDQGQPIGVLAPPTQTSIDNWGEISPNMTHAIVAVEDKRFWSSPGVDVRGLIRAAVSDVTGGQHEGGSTIPEEFIKIVRSEENHRTIFEKLIEAGMAFQLTHKWSHRQILTEYLNTIYFGNGAVGIESAARVYFGWNHGYKPANPAGEGRGGCGDPDTQDPHRKECADVLRPWEAALLAAMVANPTAYNPLGTNQEQAAATTRRNTVLEDMWQQGYISLQQYDKGKSEPLPTAQEVQQPQEPSAAPYFTSWVRPQIINALEREGVPKRTAQYEAYYGGLKIKLTIDLNLQQAAQHAVEDEFPPGSNGPTASLVAIDNKTGEVRAMVSGDGDFQQSPFNLATLGYRQPGSAFKIFTLAAALSTGKYSPYSDFDSKQITIPFVNKDGNAFEAGNGTGHFPVRNFGNEYAGLTSLTTATATSDNSVFAQLGLAVGTKYVKEYARKLGIRSPISTNPSMILGGLKTGVSALDMAHAYETVANGGKKVYNNTLGDRNEGPIGIHSISDCNPCYHSTILNKPRTQQVVSPEVAGTIDELLHGPVDDGYGTGTAAAIPGVDVVGKTGTTSNYVDAWFVGWTPSMTVAVWVGYPNSGKPMTTNYDGGPVEGGTFPAVIFHNFVSQAISITDAYAEHKKPTLTNTETTQLTPAYTAPTTSSSTATATATTQTSATSNTANQNTGATQTPPAQTGAPSTGGSSSGTPSQSVTPPASSTPPPPASAPTTGSSGGSGL